MRNTNRSGMVTNDEVGRWRKTPEGWENGRWIITSRKNPTLHGYDPDFAYSLFTLTQGGGWRLVEASNQLAPLKRFAEQRGTELVNLPE